MSKLTNTRDEIVTRILDLGVVGKVLSDMTDIEGDMFCDELRALVNDVLVNNGDELQAAARDVIASRTDTYRAGNGRRVGIQDDSGEKCWIVPFDEMAALEALLSETGRLALSKEGSES
jgi:hypothetical protein